jgi:hypothetical protein
MVGASVFVLPGHPGSQRHSCIEMRNSAKRDRGVAPTQLPVNAGPGSGADRSLGWRPSGATSEQIHPDARTPPVEPNAREWRSSQREASRRRATRARSTVDDECRRRRASRPVCSSRILRTTVAGALPRRRRGLGGSRGELGVAEHAGGETSGPLSRGSFCGQSARGACRNNGLVGGAQVPDCLGQLASDNDRGHTLGTHGCRAVAGALVGLAVGLGAAGMLGGLDQSPAQVPGAVLLQRPAAIAAAAHADQVGDGVRLAVRDQRRVQALLERGAPIRSCRSRKPGARALDPLASAISTSQP